MIGAWWILSLVALSIEMVLLGLALAMYMRIHRTTQGRLMLGFEAFLGVFIVQTAIGIWAVLNFYTHLGTFVSIPLAAFNLTSMIGVATLFYVLRT